MKIKEKMFLFLIISLLISPNLSLAQNSDTTNSKRATIKEQLEAKKEEIKSSVAERRENVANKIQERAFNFVEKVKERLEAAINRLEVLAQRIESRITKMKEAGISTTEAEKLLKIAKDKINKAEENVSLISLTTDLPTTTSSTTSEILRSAFATSKSQIEQAKKDLKSAHAALVDVINSLKPGYNKLKAVSTDDSQIED